MTRTPALAGAAALCALLLSGGTAVAKTVANTKWLNTKWLNTKWLNTADLNASTGGASFYNPSTGETLPLVTLDRSTFVSKMWKCGDGQLCRWAERRGDAFVGTWTSAVMSDGTPTYTYIAGRFQPPGASADTYLYWIYAWAADASGNWGWQPPCLDSSGAATPAIPLAGEWNHTTGARVSSGGGKFTWACTGGALGKCAASGQPNTLGYAPWRQDWYYTPDASGTWVSVDGQRTHQTCTRMIRADYCGDGQSHTVDGTAIDVRDQLWAGQRDEMTTWAAEAVWSETGARWISCMRLQRLPGGGLTCPNNHHIIDNAHNGKVCLPVEQLPWPEWLENQEDSGWLFNMGVYKIDAGDLLLANRTSSLQSAR